MRVAPLCLALASCASQAPPSAPHAPSAPSASTAPASSSSHAVQVVNATILANGCQHLGKANAQLAESAMYQLVEGCSSVPGGSAQFVALLLPGGRIEISSAKGGPDVVPICILKHTLQHKVALAKPCRLDVKIEQSSMALSPDGGAR